MELTAGLEAGCPPARLFAWVEDLARYPAWLDIVRQARPDDAAPGDPGPAWEVDLRGRLGPLARSKRLRMVRTEHASGSRARFERRELDGRSHSSWILDVSVDGSETASRLTMYLHYGGALFGPVLHRLLSDEIERSRPRLAALAETGQAR